MINIANMSWFILILIFIFGASVGSFLNVVVLRLPAGKNLKGRSHCQNCKTTLGFWELWPVFSFIFLKGRCKTCGQKISWRYPAVELITGLIFLFSWVWIAPQAAAEWTLVLQLWLLAAFCIAVFIIDYEHFLILDSIVFPFAAVFIAINFLLDVLNKHPGFNTSLFGFLGFLAGVLPFFLIWVFSKGRLMGFGDVKLMLPLGLVLGWPEILVGLFLAVFSGSLVGIILLFLGRKSLKSPLPFGCFLAIGAFLAKIFGSGLIVWYLSLLRI